jgi:hypothetical protein
MPIDNGHGADHERGNGTGTATALLHQSASAAGKVLRHLRTVEWSGPELDGAAQVRTRPLAIRRIDPKSVAGVTAFIAGIASLTLWTAVLLVWVIGSISGIVGGVERFLHDIGFSDFRFMSMPVLGAMLLLTAVGVVSAIAFTTLMALAYNYYAASLGQLTIEIDDGDVPAAAPPSA